jgi:hypothetical protein
MRFSGYRDPFLKLFVWCRNSVQISIYRYYLCYITLNRFGL